MKENQGIAITKKLLYDGLLRLLETHELDNISITELCRESGINRATFYRHYNTPHDVLLEMQVRFTEDMYKAFDKSSSDRASPQYLEKVCTYLYDRADLLKIFIRHNSEEDFLTLIHSLMLKQIKRYEEIEGLDDMSLKLVSAFIAGGSYNMLRQWLMEDIPKTPREISELVLRFASLDPKIK